MADGDEIRDGQRAAWAGLSSSWEKWDRLIIGQMTPVTGAMVAALPPDVRRLLDVAAGTGEPGLTVARSMPSAQVVLADLSAEMLAVAERRAAALGVTNVRTQVCSADDLPFDADTFDAVTVRFGFMFFPDLARATAELVRVLAPGGRLCAAVWVRPDRNPWTSIVMDAIATETALPPVDPDRPSMYRCAAEGQVAALYRAAGLHDVTEREVDVELVTESPEQYWAMMSDHVSLVAAALRGMADDARERVRRRAIEGVRPYERDGTVRVPGAARGIVGTKPTG